MSTGAAFYTLIPSSRDWNCALDWIVIYEAPAEVFWCLAYNTHLGANFHITELAE
jgi:hypothetical protein